MGEYLIPGVGLEELPQAIDHVRQQGALTEAQVWDHGVEGGTLFTDPAQDDAACAALYAGFVPDPTWVRPLSAPLAAAASVIKQLASATDEELAAMTTTQERTALRALARGLIWSARRLGE